ncbi:binding-protein-dependent transport systems inner membrane component [Rubrobacter xylanophilus DSM 9941]|uniref:Binding-protein-dependent transport systems inner membrane component n=1 Tax=Rubrobacter xylanophilus (strain DSM 9941 / JCM 11954 / NBRC 16129 / PRD-1) TaxID=266117 RepID=Q1ARN3_RUBXD|nr:ABC transporter permease [Rubrobacter xylanophilus]ABG05945.1 binding-protein-dependent transport systems inner membrane component [Rubrobacter xylanophilus DSM 9941]
MEAIARHQQVRPQKRRSSSFKTWLYAVLSAGLVFGMWQLATILFDIPTYILPTPVEVTFTAFEERQRILDAIGVTGLEAVGGFIVGNFTGFLAATLIAYSTTAARTLLPIGLAIQSIPIVALTPFLTLLFGRGFATVMIIAAIIVFFPTLVNGVLGFRSVRAEALEMLGIMSASDWQVFWHLRFPTALPNLFAAFRIGAATSILGAMIAEWVTTGSGLGYLILQAGVNFEVELMWAAILISSMLALTALALISLVENLLCPWIVET